MSNPTVATPAASLSNPVTGLTVSLSVLGADAGGEASLTYTWATTGSPPAAVSWSPHITNGTNEAKNNVAIVVASGSYTFQCTIKNTSNNTVTSSVTVTVAPTLTNIVVTPSTATIAPSATQQFTASGRDQFYIALSSQPSFAWAVSGGSINASTGLFTAGGSPDVPYTVTATSGGVSGTSTVLVSNGTSSITPSLVASRVSGYAPLAVHFDATGAVSTKAGMTDYAQGGTFRQIKHSFDFGDTGSGTWSIDGLSKNTEPSGVGLAAHVYDTPGTYTVTITSTDGTNTASTTATITVSDPSALTTYAISKTGSFTGAPVGSTHLTQSTLPTFVSNCRYFFNKGETWTGTTLDIEDGCTNIHVDAYGTGAKPIFDTVWVGGWRPNTANFANDITISNLKLTTSGPACNIAYRVLFYNIDAIPGGNIGATWIQDDQYHSIPFSSMINAHELFFVNCNLLGDGSSQEYTIFGSASRLVLLNTHTGGVVGMGSGDIRLTATDRSLIRHCNIECPQADTSVHALKMHSGGPNAYADNWLASGGSDTLVDVGHHNWMMSKVVIANTTLGGGSGAVTSAWTVAISPQNDAYGLSGSEPIQDVVVENCGFVHGAGWSGNLDVAWRGKNITSRGNTVVSGSGAFTTGLSHQTLTSFDGPYFNDSSSNTAPVVNAGTDQAITLPATASLVGAASDDGLPNPPGTLTTTWSKVSGPGTVTFGNANVTSTTATFSTAGTYVLRLTANDSVLSTSDDLTVVVSAAFTGISRHWRMKLL